MAEELRVQVAREHYDFRSYAAKPRFCSYWHQVDEVLAFRPETLLLIGGGDGLVAGILRQACPALSITTFDFDAALSPDIIGDIRSIGETVGQQYDCILCCQVLEHVEFRYFGPILAQLADIAPHVVLSIPCQCRTFGFSLDLPKLHIGKKWYPEKRRMEFAFDGQHYWEAGTKGHSKRAVETLLRERFVIKNSYHVPEKPWHLFYILERRDG